MSKITLTNLANLQNETTAVNAINANNTTLTTAMDNTLSRDGTAPNTMNATIDMNSNRILNLPSPATSQEPLRFTDLSSFVGGGTVTNIPAGGATGAILSKNSATDFDVLWRTEAAEVAAGTNIIATGTFPVTIATVANPNFGTSVTTPSILNATIGNTNTINIKDASFTIQDDIDTTKQLRFDCTGITTGTSKTLTIPNINDTLVTKTSTDTFTNKTFNTAGAGNVLQINGIGITQTNGSGNVILDTSPTLTTPILGAATATTINKVTITQPATGATLTIANNKTLTNNNNLTLNAVDGKSFNLNKTLTFDGTDGTTLTFQGTDTYVGRATTDTFTNKTFNTAGAGNSFQVNGQIVTALTGVSGTLAVSNSFSNNDVPRWSSGLLAASGITADGTNISVAGLTTTTNFFNSTGGFKRVTSQFDKTSNTTLGDITGLSATVVSTNTYIFEAYLYTTSNSASGIQVAVGGTATATTLVADGFIDNYASGGSGGGSYQVGRQTTMGTKMLGITTATTGGVRIWGLITVNAGGTLTMQFAQNVSGGTASSVLVGSWMRVFLIT